jgi:putative ABC transport system substrate-binding protein
MRRREFITLLGGAAAWPLAARAEQSERVRRVAAFIAGAAETDPQVAGQSFRRGQRQGSQKLVNVLAELT